MLAKRLSGASLVVCLYVFLRMSHRSSGECSRECNRDQYSHFAPTQEGGFLQTFERRAKWQSLKVCDVTRRGERSFRLPRESRNLLEPSFNGAPRATFKLTSVVPNLSKPISSDCNTEYVLKPSASLARITGLLGIGRWILERN